MQTLRSGRSDSATMWNREMIPQPHLLCGVDAAIKDVSVEELGTAMSVGGNWKIQVVQYDRKL